MLHLSLSLSLSGYAEVLTASGVTIPLVCCMPRGGRAAGKRHCLLFSHGNAEDLGMVYDWFREVSRELDCNVLAYDYTGQLPRAAPPKLPSLQCRD